MSGPRPVRAAAALFAASLLLALAIVSVSHAADGATETTEAAALTAQPADGAITPPAEPEAPVEPAPAEPLPPAEPQPPVEPAAPPPAADPVGAGMGLGATEAVAPPEPAPSDASAPPVETVAAAPAADAGNAPSADAKAESGDAGTASVAERAPAPKITICHATGSETNPYVEITISENGLHGHLNNPNHQNLEDIIPAPPGGCPDGSGDVQVCQPTGDPSTPYALATIPEADLADALANGAVLPIDGACPAGDVQLCHSLGNGAYEVETIPAAELAAHQAANPQDVYPVPEDGCPTPPDDGGSGGGGGSGDEPAQEVATERDRGSDPQDEAADEEAEESPAAVPATVVDEVDEELPFTGFDPLTFALIGLAMLMLGFVARRLTLREEPHADE